MLQIAEKLPKCAWSQDPTKGMLQIVEKLPKCSWSKDATTGLLQIAEKLPGICSEFRARSYGSDRPQNLVSDRLCVMLMLISEPHIKCHILGFLWN